MLDRIFIFGFISIPVTLSPYYVQEIVPLLYCTVQNSSFLNSFNCLVNNSKIHVTDPLITIVTQNFFYETCTQWSLLKFVQSIPVSLKKHMQGCYSEKGFHIAWTVILSVYGTDTIAIDLSLFALISWFMK